MLAICPTGTVGGVNGGGKGDIAAIADSADADADATSGDLDIRGDLTISDKGAGGPQRIW